MSITAVLERGGNRASSVRAAPLGTVTVRERDPVLAQRIGSLDRRAHHTG
jgi:hypothetical protein